MGTFAIRHVDHAAHGTVAVHQADGPRSTSICVASMGSDATAWSGADGGGIVQLGTVADARRPSMPRMMGRLAPAPKWLLVMPGSLLNVSPAWPRRRNQSSPSSTVTGVVMSPAPSCGPLAETVTEGRLASAAAAGTTAWWAWVWASASPCSNQSNSQGHGAQGKAARGQCGMNHEETRKSKIRREQGGDRGATRSCNSPRGHRPACPATIEQKAR